MTEEAGNLSSYGAGMGLKPRYVVVPLSMAPFQSSFLDAVNGYATGGSTRCLEEIQEEGAWLLSTLQQAGEPSPAQEVAWPEKWSGPCTVGNMIANLATLPADMPIHTAYHIVRDGQPSILRVKRPTLSRERCDGFTIKTGDEAVPYSAVIWAHPREPDAPTQPDAGEAVVRDIKRALESTDKIANEAFMQGFDRSILQRHAEHAGVFLRSALAALTGTQQAKGEG